jgi:hypothetical protein
MSTGWTVVVVVAVAGGAGLAGYFLGQRRGRKLGAGMPGPQRAMGPVIDPKIAAAALLASQGSQKIQKV